MIVHQFDTGRFYTKHGHRIRWLPLPSHEVTIFVDVDRNLHGLILKTCETDSQVLHAYDTNDYFHCIPLVLWKLIGKEDVVSESDIESIVDIPGLIREAIRYKQWKNEL